MWTLYRRPGEREEIQCIRWPKPLFWPFSAFSRPIECKVGACFQPKRGSKMVGQGCPDQTKQVGLFQRIFTPTFQKNQLPRHNSLISSKSGIPPFLACKSPYRLWTYKTLKCPKNRDFCNQRKCVFSMLWNHCSGISDLKVEFVTEDLVKEKQ